MTEAHAATSDYVLNQTTLPIKDPEPSLRFYQDVLGMTLYQKVDFPEMSFSLYFLGHPSNHKGNAIPSDPNARCRFTLKQSALSELTHNWCTETDPEFPATTTAMRRHADSARSGLRYPIWQRLRALRVAGRHVRQKTRRGHHERSRFHTGPRRLLDRDPQRRLHHTIDSGTWGDVS